MLAGVALLSAGRDARAETYGELGHFGSPGTARGEFKLVGAPNKGTHALGVDPIDNSVYVGDEPEKRKYRIQKFTASGQFLAETGRLEPPNRYGIEGVAVDPALKRIYVLALERRSETAKLDPAPDGAAGTLYAFSAEPVAETLVPAPGTNSEGALVGPGEFQAASEVPEKALLNPAGIAVDPTDHDVIVLGHVDAGTKNEESQLEVALQRVHADGALGARYVDSSGFFALDRAPTSPIVSPQGSVYVAIEQQQRVKGGGTVGEFAQVPSDFTSTAPPTTFFQFAELGEFPGEEFAVVDTNDGEPTEAGGALSIAPEGAGGAGTIYAKAKVLHKGIAYPGVLAFDGAAGEELGWTGGQTKSAGESCVLPTGEPTYSVIAAGGERKVFVLDAVVAHVIELGPEGTGCPTAEASELTANVNGKPLQPSEPLSPGTPVTFSSTLTQANATSVEWNFGDGETETVETDEYQHTEITHSFARGGELTVTETIHTDNLATPTLVNRVKISVSNVAVPPTAVLEGPLQLTLGTPGPERLVYLEGGGLGLQDAQGGGEAEAVASFDGSASFDPNPPGSNRIIAYHWVFGDGSAATTTTPTTTHGYRQPGPYEVELTVTDALGLTSEPTTLSVKVNPAPAPPAKSTPPPAVAAVPAAAASAPAAAPASVPAVSLANRSLASRGGAVELVLTCPAAETSCAGTVTLQTLAAVAAHAQRGRTHARSHRTAVLILAKTKFTVSGGHQKVLTLHLTATARALLARAHELRVRVTIAARDGAGATHVAQSVLALHPAKSPGRDRSK